MMTSVALPISRDSYGALLLMLAAPTLLPGIGMMAAPLAFVPFSNTIPALSLGLVGAGLMVRKSLFSWLGMALSGGYTALLIILGETLILATQGILARLT